jgi:hypothetical protein
MRPQVLTINLNFKDIDNAVKNMILALTTDGAHHKQYYIEQAFRSLCTDEYVDEAKNEFQWEDGIPS